MTKKIDGDLFEEPAVIIGCPDYYSNGILHSGAVKAMVLISLYGGMQARGRWKGEDEACIIMPLSTFTAHLHDKSGTNGMALRTHIQKEECIAVFYRLPRNPWVLMCGMRKAPALFADVWTFVANEDTDAIVEVGPDSCNDGLLLGGVCLHSSAKA